MIKYTTRLYAMPSWISGAARVLDIGGTLNEYNFSEDPAEADYLAIASDWAAVGLDLKAAIKDFKNAPCNNNKKSTKKGRKGKNR